MPRGRFASDSTRDTLQKKIHDLDVQVSGAAGSRRVSLHACVSIALNRSKMAEL